MDNVAMGELLAIRPVWHWLSDRLYSIAVPSAQVVVTCHHTSVPVVSTLDISIPVWGCFCPLLEGQTTA